MLPGVLSSGTTQYPLQHSRRRGLPPCPATTHAITFAVEPLCFVVQADVAWPYSLEPPQTLLFRNRPRCFLVFSPLVPPSIHCSILAGAGSRPVQPPLTPLHLLLNHCVLLCRLMWHGRIALNRHKLCYLEIGHDASWCSLLWYHPVSTAAFSQARAPALSSHHSRHYICC